MLPTVMEYDDEDEEVEYIPTPPLGDEVWLEEPIPERELCIHMAPRRPETRYTPWATTYPQEYIPEQAVVYPQEYIPRQAISYSQEYIPEQATTYQQEYIPEQVNPDESDS